MKAYLVLKYSGDECSVVDVYATGDGALERVRRLEHEDSLLNYNTTYHVIKKSIKGLAGIKITVDGKKRYLEANVGNIKKNVKKRMS